MKRLKIKPSRRCLRFTEMPPNLRPMTQKTETHLLFDEMSLCPTKPYCDQHKIGPTPGLRLTAYGQSISDG